MEAAAPKRGKGRKKAAGEGGKRKKKRHYDSFSSYIYKVLKQVHPKVGISSKAMSVMNSFVDDMLNKIASEATRLATTNKHITMTSREVQTAVRIVMGPLKELVKHAVSEGTKAVLTYNRTKVTGEDGVNRNPALKKSTGRGKAAKAGITFSVGRVTSRIRDGSYTNRISSTAPVYLAAVLEYLCAEVLELAGNAAQELKKTRITPRCIVLAMRKDEELDLLLGSGRTMIGRSGNTVPYIHPKLLPKKVLEGK